MLRTIWEALSPDPCLSAYAKDFKWLTQVYESVKPVSGNGRLLWHRLGAKTIELINENVHVEAVRDDIEALVLDADVLDSILKDANKRERFNELKFGIPLSYSVTFASDLLARKLSWTTRNRSLAKTCGGGDTQAILSRMTRPETSVGRDVRLHGRQARA